MPIGAYTDKNHLPSPEEIQEGLGAQWATWQELSQFVIETYKPSSEFKFYGKNYGWALRFRKSGKALLSLYPGREGFTVQMILSEDQIRRAKQNELGENSLGAIDAANPYPEGRWLFIAMQSAGDLVDVKRMLAVKIH
ncbi:MAG: DUF3788 family protein [Anaerolineaceae bacterium]|nr:DUF3788 family protein [Anaerolineaceae bacterium]